MFNNFRKPGKASFLVGGQWGSEGKGAAAAFTALNCGDFDIVTTNAGAQAGHTSTHDGVTKVVFHLPTYSLYQPVLTYLNAGSIIDPVGLLCELEDNPQVVRNGFAIHPNAAIITQSCRDAEMRDDSAQTKIASTRKGVGEALSRKVLRSGATAGMREPTSLGHKRLRDYVRRIDLNDRMRIGLSVLAEVPQGHSLSLDGPFYPHTTSRNCTVMQAMSDAGIHPEFYHTSMMVIRTFPIRVGNITKEMVHPVDDIGITGLVGYSGGHFPDQRETSWAELGVAAEITTVTKRVRRVFTFSQQQVAEAIAQTRPSVIYLTFCDYHQDREKVRYLVSELRTMAGSDVEILTQWGPTTADVIPAEELWA